MEAEVLDGNETEVQAETILNVYKKYTVCIYV